MVEGATMAWTFPKLVITDVLVEDLRCVEGGGVVFNISHYDIDLIFRDEVSLGVLALGIF